jgi:alpha-tubulin suppressor-like RCC1 family protein
VRSGRFLVVAACPLAIAIAACGSRTALDIPAPPVQPPAFRAVVGGTGFSCALHVSGGVKCWGANAHGELGDGTTTDSDRPVQVSGIAGVTALAAGQTHACALLADGTAWCWGGNETGELGDGASSGIASSVPVAVAGLRDARAIAAGDGFTCAVRSGGQVACWGVDLLPTPGGAAQILDSPTEVPGIGGAVAVAAGAYNACALLASGQVACWGDDRLGEIGTPACPPLVHPAGSLTNPPCPTPPTIVRGVSGAVGVAVGTGASCAWMADGSARCWGSEGDGDLGNGQSEWTSATAQSVAGLSSVTAMAMGFAHVCALVSGSVWCWGRNHSGQVGDGNVLNSSVPMRVGGLTAVDGIGVGAFHACAIAGQSIACWGDDSTGELGNAGAVVDSCEVDWPGGTACARTPVTVDW